MTIKSCEKTGGVSDQRHVHQVLMRQHCFYVIPAAVCDTGVNQRAKQKEITNCFCGLNEDYSIFSVCPRCRALEGRWRWGVGLGGGYGCAGGLRFSA